MVIVNKISARSAALIGEATAGLRREEGQGMTEYALILALIIAISVGLLTVYGGDLSSAFSNIASKI